MRTILVAALLLSSTAQGREANDNLPSSARAGIDLYYMQQASYDRDNRYAYVLGYNWAVLPFLRLDNYFVYAPDESTKTEVKFTEDLYILAPTVAVTYPFLFRFVLAAGPAFIYTKSDLEFRGEHSSHKVSQVGEMIRVSTEYVVTDCCEVIASLGVIVRPHDDKMDWSYGIAYSQNIGPVSYKTAPKAALHREKSKLGGK